MQKTIKLQARVVVIGGGIAGTSTLYHLTKEGWTDVVLVERDELTSGSTWHAAAQVTQFGANQTMFGLKRHSIDLYRELAADPDFPINYHITGGMCLAHNQNQIDLYKHFIGVAGGIGVEMEYIDAAEAGKRHPLLNTDGLLGAWWDPLDGDIDPAQLVFALARKAKQTGAEIYRFNPNAEFVDQHSFHFTPTKQVVAKEIEGIAKGVGMMEVSGFNRYQIKGKGAKEFLDKMICGNLPKATGKVNLYYLLTEKGNVLCEATLTKLGKDHYWYGSAAAAEWHDRDWLNQHKPDTVCITEMAASHTVLVFAGPKSRELLQSVSPRSDLSAQAFPWMHAKSLFIGHAEVIAMSVSFSGELAYELHVPNEQLYLTWKTLLQAGKVFGLVQFGLYAAESMRLEKGYKHWKADLIYEQNPIESGLERFVNLDKNDFIGKAALLEQLKRGHRKLFVTMEIDCDKSPAHSGDPVFAADKQVGTVSSAGYGHRVNKNLAYAFVEPTFAALTTNLEVGILGQRYAARVTEDCLYDPENKKVKA